MKDYEELWNELKADILEAIKEGYNRGLNCQLEGTDYGLFLAYRTVGDTMCNLEGVEGGIYNWD